MIAGGNIEAVRAAVTGNSIAKRNHGQKQQL